MHTPIIDTDIAKAEAILEPLIREHGYETVRAHLDTLIGHWSTWQRLDSLAKSINRRINNGLRR
jgi:3-methyladenine DNA glycosylase AlkD